MGALLGSSITAPAETTLFSHTFEGGAVNLNGTSPDIGSVNWVATPTNFLADGNTLAIDASDADPDADPDANPDANGRDFYRVRN